MKSHFFQEILNWIKYCLQAVAYYLPNRFQRTKGGNNKISISKCDSDITLYHILEKIILNSWRFQRNVATTQ